MGILFKSLYNLILFFRRRQSEPEKDTNEEFSHELIVEPSNETERGIDLTGRRIIDINFFLNELKSLNNHSMLGCNLNDIIVVSETKHGFRSSFRFECKMCRHKKTIWSEETVKGVKNVNIDAVAGIISIGVGYSNLEELFSTMNIPCMTNKTYSIMHGKVSQA